MRYDITLLSTFIIAQCNIGVTAVTQNRYHRIINAMRFRQKKKIVRQEIKKQNCPTKNLTTNKQTKIPATNKQTTDFLKTTKNFRIQKFQCDNLWQRLKHTTQNNYLHISSYPQSFLSHHFVFNLFSCLFGLLIVCPFWNYLCSVPSPSCPPSSTQRRPGQKTLAVFTWRIGSNLNRNFSKKIHMVKKSPGSLREKREHGNQAPPQASLHTRSPQAAPLPHQ